MKKIIISILATLLIGLYLFNTKNETNYFSFLKNKEGHNQKKGLSDGIYFLYKKCNLTHKKCHELKPMLVNGSYFLDSDQQPYEERMYLYIKNNISIAYSLIYYDEEMIPTITWSKLLKDNTNPFTYQISENTTISGIEYDINDINSSNLENINRVKIGDTPKGKTKILNQTISFNLEKNGDLSIDCKKNFK